MKKCLLIAALLSALLLGATACSDPNPPAETEENATVAQTVAETLPETEAETPPETAAPETVPETLPETVAETPAETEADTLPETEGETEEKQLPPGLFRVGYSYSGNLDCYDGSYDFGFPVCTAEDGTAFNSVQDCVDYMETCGGGAMTITTYLDICLFVKIPDDGNSYIMYYNYHNCDFVFNHGYIYDDSNIYADVIGTPGFAYYSDLSRLDAISGLENTSIWVCTDDHETFEKARYSMTAAEDGDTTNYHYEKIGEMDEWYGLIEGEYLPEE